MRLGEGKKRVWSRDERCDHHCVLKKLESVTITFHDTKVISTKLITITEEHIVLFLWKSRESRISPFTPPHFSSGRA